MEPSADSSNWIPTSFSGTSETGDSLNSFQSATTPRTVDQQSDDQSFDEISRQKLNMMGLGTPKSALFEEDTRSSWSVEPPKLQTPFKETALDEDSQNSNNSQKSSLKRQCSDDEESKQEQASTFPPENLFEYMWPQDNGEFFILQEQICDYLNVKSFKRKYPDLTRRTVDMDEKQFLKDRGVVSEMQCDLGLTALRSEEVLELMSKDYPTRYKEYITILREKQQQSLSEKHREYVVTASTDKTKIVDLIKKAVRSAAEYNAHLNQERREERRTCMDTQTYTILYPGRTNKAIIKSKQGKYPVALLPGQFQDYYKEYSSDELKYLPINTVLYGPLKELPSIQAGSDGSPSDSEESSDGSCCSSSRDDSSSGSEDKPKAKPDAVCKVCKKGGELVHCADCENSVHPSCVELSASVVDVLKTYPWQCTDCKVCSQCRDPNDEDKMLFCDVCDRGYHTFCVGLKALPQGKWVCGRCGCCAVCGCVRPGPESSGAQWQHEVADGNRRPRILCQACFKKK
ncbi:PHD finger protein 10 [Trichonephila inaurata madagascariensis]|uniref:PHD finger protein 10 n=1 Tax=Trichonephila inaurata madagascariensis TaxID=2747483 RepID=A0A8X6WMY6_9ARAC|nr:PHD finger protein 10 [Trichonephila inaurata madagascariensis]